MGEISLVLSAFSFLFLSQGLIAMVGLDSGQLELPTNPFGNDTDYFSCSGFGSLITGTCVLAVIEDAVDFFADAAQAVARTVNFLFQLISYQVDVLPSWFLLLILGGPGVALGWVALTAIQRAIAAFI